jgi:hypothetical protein
MRQNNPVYEVLFRLQQAVPVTFTVAGFSVSSSVINWSRGSVWLRAGRFGVRIPAGAKNFLFLRSVQTGFGAHSASSGYWGFFSAVKREVDN